MQGEQDMGNRTRRLAFTGNMDVNTPFEELENGEIESLEESALYTSEETDMYVFDYLGHKRKSVTFFFEESQEFTRLDVRNVDGLLKFSSKIEEEGLNYAYSDVPWISGSGFHRLTESMRETDYDPELYLNDLREFYHEEWKKLPHS
jgi:hypothetical protein